jgi:hypothetical protein
MNESDPTQAALQALILLGAALVMLSMAYLSGVKAGLSECQKTHPRGNCK